jgi:flagellar protein FliT
MENLILDCYEKISAASTRMLAAASSGDWDALIEAEGECSRIVSRLQDMGENEPLSKDGTRRKMQFIRKVLAEDAEIRGLTQPWLDNLESLLRGQVSQRRVRDLYA